jgi:hypothetical protein
MKTLLYLAAGPYLEAYSHLLFDKLIFVEKDDNYWAQSYLTIPPNTEWICLDALKSIDKLKERNIKADYLVSLNEGLNEGGGGYAILSDEVMGYLSPILKDEFILICDFSHYPLKVKDHYARLDWGFKKVNELKKGDFGFIDPKIFTESQKYNSGNFGHVFKMKRINRSYRLSISNQNIQVKIVHGSIWEDEAKLDTIGLSFYPSKLVGNAAYNSQSISDFLESKPKVFNLRNKSFDDVLGFCDKYKIKHLGLCPWLQGDYQGVINRLQGALPNSLESISFYHLNSNDFEPLYTLSADYFASKYPNLFMSLKNDYNNMFYFEEALSFGIGKYLLELCDKIQQYISANPSEEQPHFRQIKVKFKDLRVHLSFKNDYYKNAITSIRDLVYEELNQI